MNREKRETREKGLFPDECYAILGTIFDAYRTDLLVNFSAALKL
jgi:hypothetical protein